MTMNILLMRLLYVAFSGLAEVIRAKCPAVAA